MRYKLRTLLIVLALGPPVLWLGWGQYEAWREKERRRAFYESALPADATAIRVGVQFTESTAERPPVDQDSN